jgi:MFS family permease
MLFTISAIVATSFIGVSLPYPILAPYILGGQIELLLGTSIRLNPEQTLAAILAAYPAGMFFGNIILGACADRFGRKKTLSLSVSASAICYLISAITLISGNMLGLILSRLATGVFEGNVPIARAMAADLKDVIPTATSFGYIGGAVYVGYLIGPVIGGAFAGYSIALPFFIASALMVISLLLIAYILEEPRARTANATAENSSKNGSPWSILSDRRILHLFVVNVLATLAVFSFYQFYPLLLVTNLDFGPADIAIVTVVLTIALWYSSTFLVSATNNRYDVRNTLVAAGLVFAITFFVFPSLPGIISVSALFILTGILIPLFTTHLGAYTSDQLKEDRQGALMGLLGSGGAAGSTLIVLFGVSGASWSIWFPVFLGAGVAVSSVVYFLIFVPRSEGEES